MKKPKYCEMCGKELVSKVVNCGFDMMTGNTKTKEVLECPEYDKFNNLVEEVSNKHKRVIEEFNNHNKSSWRRFWNYKSVNCESMGLDNDFLEMRGILTEAHTRVEL